MDIQKKKRDKYQSVVVLIVAIFPVVFLCYLIPKSSWIHLYSDIETCDIQNFRGEYIISSDSIDFNQACFQNESAITVWIGEKNYKCKSGEFKVYFKKEEVNLEGNSLLRYFAKYTTDNKIRLYPNSLRFSKNVVIYENTHFTEMDNLQIERHKNIYKSQPNYYILYMNSRNKRDTAYNNTRIKVDNDTTIYFYGLNNFQISIDNTIIDINDLHKITFSNTDMSCDYAIFSLRADYVECFYLSHDRNYIYIKGDCQSFREKSGSSSELKQTYLNTQKEYDTALLEVSAYSDPYKYDHFQMEWELIEYNSKVRISGLANDIKIAGNSINFSFLIFIYENFSSICLAVFGVIITSYADKILKEKSKRE